jgi:branched-chain amino acid transport system ATP-binding protein
MPTLVSDNENIMVLDDVYAGYGDVEILKGVTCSIKRNSIICIIGANGAGKSTLLKTIFGILKTRRGQINFDGKNIVGLSPEKVLRLGISYVPQGRCNFPGMSVKENLEMGAYIRKDSEISLDIDALCDKFPILQEKINEMAGNLSGGQQQILEMAMALILHPKLLLVDEPSLGLSPIMTGQIMKTIQEISATGTSVIMVEQNAKQALETANYAFVLELGRNWLDGPSEIILNDHRVRMHYLGL